MDRWLLEKKMGVVNQAALQVLIKGYQATMAGLLWARTMCWVVQHL